MDHPLRRCCHVPFPPARYDTPAVPVRRGPVRGRRLGHGISGGHSPSADGQPQSAFCFPVQVEELLEMTGVGVFMYALAAYVATETQELRLRIAHRSIPAPFVPNRPTEHRPHDYQLLSGRSGTRGPLRGPV